MKTEWLVNRVSGKGEGEATIVFNISQQSSTWRSSWEVGATEHTKHMPCRMMAFNVSFDEQPMTMSEQTQNSDDG